jgi:hypothetical protein
MINGCRNLDDLPNRSCPPCYLKQGRVYANHPKPDTPAATLPGPWGETPELTNEPPHGGELSGRQWGDPNGRQRGEPPAAYGEIKQAVDTGIRRFLDYARAVKDVGVAQRL